MSNDKNQIMRATGLLVIEAINSNPNGDPDRESDPRQRPDGLGEISPVSFKRKLRDLVEDKQGPVWTELKSRRALNEDEFHILESRGRDRGKIKEELKDEAKVFKKKYWDARVFGNTFLEENASTSIKTGVVQFGMGLSVAPVIIERHTNTNKAGVEGDKDRGMAPMAYRIVQHGIYCMPFFVNPSAAHKSGCTAKDIQLLLDLIPHAYAHSRSYVRPNVEILHAWHIEHKSALGSCSDFKLIDALTPTRKEQYEQTASTSRKEYDIPTALSQEIQAKVACCNDLMEF
ncbi:type I CRISPR-associated protein Cas7 [Geobacter sp. DSM 9736]|uniref:type I CRISPR-associated protein Cas7 n=1 Tax=Geobacter sp. DSM 9736 TaxID=1277350 RepID=UPI000B512628|nr:type I CRISPR-associated protein Cas7 [Geobacter sp. DSM 9736]SNB46412.1 CRISPR-associated protein, CT1132 family [Geobacter sp. DSM 9736]